MGVFDTNLDPTLLTALSHLSLGVLFSVLLQMAYVRFGTSLSNRDQFGRIFPLVTIAVIIVITVVKTSLALSLGLIGALSIVRFRTPVKEPEELAYLFLSIALGIGLGADQVAFTVVAGVFILVMIVVFDLVRMRQFRSQNLYVTLRWPHGEEAPTPKTIAAKLASVFKVCDIRRVDTDGNETRAAFHVQARNSDEVFDIVETLRRDHPSFDIAVVEHQRVPGA